MAIDSAALTKALDWNGLDRIAEPLASTVRGAYESQGAVGQQVKDLAHGVWLGHPLHPVLTDIPVGAWTVALALDAAAADDPGMRRAARLAIGVGLVGALGAAVTGLTDWSETSGRSRRLGLVHGLLNIAATGLMAASWLERGNGGRSAGLATRTYPLEYYATEETVNTVVFELPEGFRWVPWNRGYTWNCGCLSYESTLTQHRQTLQFTDRFRVSRKTYLPGTDYRHYRSCLQTMAELAKQWLIIERKPFTQPNGLNGPVAPDPQG